MKSSDIIIYTDGSSRGNPGPGGWGAIIAYNDSESKVESRKSKVVELGGGEKHTTNNRMELMAAIESLQLVRDLGSAFTIDMRADSRYVINGITKWVFGWQKNGWRTSQKGEVLNRELWEALALVVADVQMSGSKIAWNYTPGHAGIPGNERADEIATACADGENPHLFNSVRESYTVDLARGVSHVQQRSQKSSEVKARQKMKAYSYLSLVKGVVVTHATWAECEKRAKGVSGAKWKKAVNKEDETAIRKSWGK